MKTESEFRLMSRVLAQAGCCLIAVSPAHCGQRLPEAWRSWGTEPGVSGVVRAQAIWDPDGTGPIDPELVIGGSFFYPGSVEVEHIARWDGSSWQPFATGFSSGSFGVNALTTWDPDGPGPLDAQLVAGGAFISAAGVTLNHIARWDGSGWQPFGTGMNSGVGALTTWDPDGDGPGDAQLVAGGSFTAAGGTSANYIARWDGSAWQPFHIGMTFPVNAVSSWDPDGAGPLPPQLVAGGDFFAASGVQVNKIARWSGSVWQPMGTGMNGSVKALSTFDPDGIGPLGAQLVAGGAFTTAGGANADCIARWDGLVWQPCGDGLDSAVNALTTYDRDGAGPLEAQLVAGGSFVTAGGAPASGVASWDGTAWKPFNTGVGGSPPYVFALTPWDLDGTGPLDTQLVAGGEFATAGGLNANGIARWDGSAWQSFGTGAGDIVSALTLWDTDGAGPLQAQLTIGGTFASAGSVKLNRIGRWDGSSWKPFGTGMNDDVSDLVMWDPDGSGPLTLQLVAGGRFTAAGGTSANRIARWDGSSWKPFATGMNNDVRELAVWDPDGAGPLDVQLVAGGTFITAGGLTVNRIARWDGSAWNSFGTGIGGNGTTAVLALTTWDADASGPRTEQLVAGGNFTTAGGLTVNRVARWDGSAWHPLGSGIQSGTVSALTTWDPDGAGPFNDQLVVGGSFTTAGGLTVNRIARWNGSVWQPFGTGMSGTVNSLNNWDPDGDGPLDVQLVAGGSFFTAGGLTVRFIARWNGSVWQRFGTGTNGTVYALSTWDPDGTGRFFDQLVAGGNFTFAGGQPAGFMATWGMFDPLTPPPPCAADCDASGGLSIDDFICFQTLFALGDPAADCDASGGLNIDDFICFQTAFVLGC